MAGLKKNKMNKNHFTWETYQKVVRGSCCAAPCDDCPYVKKGEGGTVRDGTNELEQWVKELMNSFSIENSPSSEFHRYPDADEVVLRLKNWNEELRLKFQQQFGKPIKKASKSDFIKYAGNRRFL